MLELTKWELKENDNGLLHIPIEDGLVISATRPEHQVGLTPEQAQLIASAPDLYEALKELTKKFTVQTEAEANAYKALAKAEGK